MPFNSRLRQYLAQRELESVTLCFLVSHRPLAFITGQLLYLVEPIFGILGFANCRAWAQGLSELVDDHVSDSLCEDRVRNQIMLGLDDSEGQH
jgi:hypothetical protein